MTVVRTTTADVGVTSEIGALREVIVHRPGIEIEQLIPRNFAKVSFGNALSAARARVEHHAFVESLRDYDVTVHLFDELLADALVTPAARAFAADRVCTTTRLGMSLAREVRALFDDSAPVDLARYLIGGLTKADVPSLRRRSLAWQRLGMDDFIMAPLPNALFSGDHAAWIGRGVTINPMANAARRRESINLRTVYRYHPRFRDTFFATYYGGTDLDFATATLQGGDILIAGPGVVVIGVGKRTTPTGVEALARALFDNGQAHLVLAIELPVTRPVDRMESILGMVDVATFVAAPDVDWAQTRCWKITPTHLTPSATDDLVVDMEIGVPSVLARALDIDTVMMIAAGGHDRTDYLALAPGVVMGFEHHSETNEALRQRGVDVVTVEGTELARGGGVRRMTCPIRRDPL